MISDNRIIIASGKGGTGKTSLVASLGFLIARSGIKIAVIDMDMGQRNLDIHLGLENRVIFDLYDVTHGICRLKQAKICPDGLPELSMISASQVRSAESFDADECARVIGELLNDNAFILFDAPSGIGAGLKLACRLAGRAIMVVTSDASSVRDAQRAMNVMKDNGVSDFSLVVNRVKPWQTAIDYEMSPELISEWLDAPILSTIDEIAGPDPLMGSKQVAQIARAITGDRSINWEEQNTTLKQKLLSIISRINKRFLNANSKSV